TLEAGDRVSLRAVLDSGQDVFYPSSPLVITAANTAADAWPLDLANAVNASSSSLVVGVLGADGAIAPAADATANQVYAQVPNDVAGTFLVVEGGAANCEMVVTNEWNTGFTATIRITNDGATPIDGWQVSWEFTDGSSVDNLWNANVTGTNPYGATNLDWNANIAPGSSVEFGFVGVKGGSGLVIPRVNGAVCN
ncbi:MAG: cellulose binding domain-containing protein, partial [Acidobacteriota bacterium]